MVEKVIHRDADRGRGDYEWLKTRYSFSFANWYEPTRMGFGALRVINDDRIAPRSGFGAHEHDNMEIITIVTEGTLTHKDSLGNRGVIEAGEVQVMSAGTGVTHSEYNEGDEPLSLFQIWLLSKKRGIEPHYDQRPFIAAENAITPIIGPHGTPGVLTINQDAYISKARLDSEHSLTYVPHDATNGVYVFVISGTLQIDADTFSARDALGIIGVAAAGLSTPSNAEALIFEVPILE
jgi:hypothetical protein